MHQNFPRKHLWLALLVALIAIIFSAVRPLALEENCTVDIPQVSADEFCGSAPYLISSCSFRCVRCAGAGCARCSCRLDQPPDQGQPARGFKPSERIAIVLRKAEHTLVGLEASRFQRDVALPHLDWTGEQTLPPPRIVALS